MNGNKVGLNGWERQDPLLGIIDGNNGFSFNPLKILSGYRANMLRRFMMHAEDIVNTPERNGKSWEDSWKNDEVGGKCKGL